MNIITSYVSKDKKGLTLTHKRRYSDFTVLHTQGENILTSPRLARNQDVGCSSRILQLVTGDTRATIEAFRLRIASTLKAVQKRNRYSAGQQLQSVPGRQNITP